ncbi:hypothetical protein P9139_16405 [Curtobacterium flaccumfaciens]|nr:hypothetical protein P9139_16405 [Curtobacterium flaccumfaciens]
MRFVLAIVSFVIGLLLVALAVGQRTVFEPPSSLVAASSSKSSAPVTVIPGSTLNANPGYQRINVSGSGKVFAAYGRTTDVNAWIGDAKHTTLRFDADQAKLVGRTTGSETSVPDPAGSDLWYQEYDGAGQFTVRLPKDVSVLIVGDGTSAAPSDVSVTWPRDTATPTVGPLLVAGAVFLVGGVVLLVWAFVHQRRGRGPRRRSGGRVRRACAPRVVPRPPAPRYRCAGAADAGPSWRSRGARGRARSRRLLLRLLAAGRVRRQPDPDRHRDRCRPVRAHRRDQAADRPGRPARGRGREEGRRSP